jgi:hypothetical protein
VTTKTVWQSSTADLVHHTRCVSHVRKATRSAWSCITYPTSGQRGHDLTHLGSLLRDATGIQIQQSALVSAKCSPAVRYGDDPSSEEQALTANHAVLTVYEDMRSTA